MKYRPPLRGKTLKKKVKPIKTVADLDNDITRIGAEFTDAIGKVTEIGEKIGKVTSDISEIRSELEDIRNVQPQEVDKQEIADFVLTQIPEPYNDIDEGRIIESVLKQIPKPDTIDKKALVKEIIGKIPESKASLKIIQKNLETDPMSVIEKIMALPEEKRKKLQLSTDNISGLQQTISAMRNQLGRGYLHGGGLSEVIHDATLTGKGTTASPLSVVTTTSGVNSINGDSTQDQFLVVGTSGSDFNIADNGTGTHTFNLPTASSTVRGALSSADWTTFNNKLSSTLAEGHFFVGNSSNVAVDAGTGIIYSNTFKSLTIDSTGGSAIPIVLNSAGNTTFGVTSSSGQAIMNLLPSGTNDSFISYKTRLILGTSGGLGAFITNYFLFDGSGNAQFISYPNTRNDSGSFAPTSFLYTDNLGNVLESPLSMVGAPALTDHQIAFGSAANLMTSSANFTYNTTTNAFNVSLNGISLINANATTGLTSIRNTSGLQISDPSGVHLGVFDIAGLKVLNGDSTSATTNCYNELDVLNQKFSMFNGRFEEAKGADVTAANDLTLGAGGNTFFVTGNTTINAITTANWQAGSQICLIFTGTPTVKHNTAGGAGTARIFLAHSTDLSVANNTVLGLVYDGTQWQETYRKVA